MTPSVSRFLAGLGAAALVALAAAPGAAHDGGDTPTNTRGLRVAESGEGTRMDWVANLQYEVPNAGEGPIDQGGTDVEFLKAGKKEYALAGTARKGLRIIDITDPTAPVEAAHYDCPIYQGDVQVWKQRGRAYAAYTADAAFDSGGVTASTSQCGRDLAVWTKNNDVDASSAQGTVIVDVSNPRKPRTVSFLPIERGSHNMTIHPSGDYLYNSNSDLITSTEPTIEVWDVSDVRRPSRAYVLDLPFTPTSLGAESHDITFNADGSRAYSAAISQTLVLDTTSPAEPSIVSNIVDPRINVSHQADPVTLTAEDGTERELLIVTDELAGATNTYECPGGGLHVYDITGDKELAPEKVGAWFIDHVSAPESRCTSHVLRIYEDQEMLTIAWYGQGVRVLDISGLADVEGSEATVALGDGVGMREVGSYVMPDADTWSFKTNRIAADGSFYGYGNDLVRGFDVYHYDGAGIDRVEGLEPVSLLDDAELDAALTGAGDGISLGGLTTPAAAGVGLAALLGVRRLVRRH